MRLPYIPLTFSVGGFMLATLLALTLVHHAFWWVLGFLGMLGMVVASIFKAVDESVVSVLYQGKPLEDMTTLEMLMMTFSERQAALDDWKRRNP